MNEADKIHRRLIYQSILILLTCGAFIFLWIVLSKNSKDALIGCLITFALCKAAAVINLIIHIRQLNKLK